MEADDIEPRHLRSALEFAVLMAQEGQKFKPPMKFPAGLKRYMKMTRIPTASLNAIRRLVEGDPTFRTRIAAGAVPELVDPIGRVWLERPEGWKAELARLVAESAADAEQADAAAALKRAEKRREAAEQATARARAEVVVVHERLGERETQLDEMRTDVVKLSESIDELRAELVDTRNELRHARDRAAAAAEKLARAEADRASAIADAEEAEVVRDHVLADRATLAAEHSELAQLAASAQMLAERLAELSASPGSPRSATNTAARRKALALPGGVLGDSIVAAEHLMRSGASILVDGYNVAKLGWPKLDLAGQRETLLDAIENLARRFGSDVTVVFDGGDVVGATADRRRIVRVAFSPPDVSADDVIRDEVRRLPARRPVVVVTNDREIVRDVRAMGANTMASDQLLALPR